MKKLIAIAALALSSCATHVSSDFQSGDAESAIRRANEAIMRAIRNGTVDDIVSTYSSRAVILPPNAPAVTSTDAIRQFWSQFLATKPDLKLTTDEVVQSEDLAVERGTYQMSVPANDSGKYLVVWRKLDGRWRITQDMFNSSVAVTK